MANSIDFGGAFEALASEEYWIEILLVFVGFLVPVVVANVIEGYMGFDLPNEVYGLGTMAGVEMVSDQHMATVGAGVYTADVFAERVGLKQSVTNFGAGN